MNTFQRPLTERFLAQHRLIQRAVHLLARLAEQTRATQELDVGLGRQFVRFFRVFLAEHHQEEERVLFPWLIRHGLAEEPLRHLVDEHRASERQLQSLTSLLDLLAAPVGDEDVSSRERFCDDAERYAAMLSEHDWKEDHVLYPMTDLLDHDHELWTREIEGARSCLDDPDEFPRWVEDVERLAGDWPPARVRLHVEHALQTPADSEDT